MNFKGPNGSIDLLKVINGAFIGRATHIYLRTLRFVSDAANHSLKVLFTYQLSPNYFKENSPYSYCKVPRYSITNFHNGPIHFKDKLIMLSKYNGMIEHKSETVTLKLQ